MPVALLTRFQLAAVSDFVEQVHRKLILVGDDRQLPEIDAGGLFRALATTLPTVMLTVNMRQVHAWERVALAELRDGSVDQALETYRDHRRLIIGHDRDDTITRAAGDWYRHVTATGDLTSGPLIAHSNRDPLDTLTASLSRSSAQAAAIDPLLDCPLPVTSIRSDRFRRAATSSHGSLGSSYDADPNNTNANVQPTASTSPPVAEPAKNKERNARLRTVRC